MKLLFDENLSPRLVRLLGIEFPGSSHVSVLGPPPPTDEAVWTYAAEHDFVIASKDGDFQQLSLVHGSPPKVVWLRIGNRSTDFVAALLKASRLRVEEFAEVNTESLLILGGPEG